MRQAAPKHTCENHPQISNHLSLQGRNRRFVTLRTVPEKCQRARRGGFDKRPNSHEFALANKRQARHLEVYDMPQCFPCILSSVNSRSFHTSRAASAGAAGASCSLPTSHLAIHHQSSSSRCQSLLHHHATHSRARLPNCPTGATGACMP